MNAKTEELENMNREPMELPAEESELVTGGDLIISDEKAKLTYKRCIQCVLLGQMDVMLYVYKRNYVCLENCHRYSNQFSSSYVGIDPEFAFEARKHT